MVENLANYLNQVHDRDVLSSPNDCKNVFVLIGSYHSVRCATGASAQIRSISKQLFNNNWLPILFRRVNCYPLQIKTKSTLHSCGMHWKIGPKGVEIPHCGGPKCTFFDGDSKLEGPIEKSCAKRLISICTFCLLPFVGKWQFSKASHAR